MASGFSRKIHADARIARLVPATPVALFLREHAAAWQTLRRDAESGAAVEESALSDGARAVMEALTRRGASFLHELAAATALDRDALHRALGEAVAAGFVASDGFSGLRAIVRSRPQGRWRDRRAALAGRWSLLARTAAPISREEALDVQARTLLARSGVVFRRLLAREANAAPWRDLVRVYRRLEARGEIRGGRFVSGMSGEQFALGEAVDRLREVRRTKPDGHPIAISAADPLNLTGLLTPGDRIRAIASSRIVYRDGVPVAAREGGRVRPLVQMDATLEADVARAAGGPGLASGRRALAASVPVGEPASGPGIR